MNSLLFSTVSFVTSDVTGSLRLEAENVQGEIPAGAVAASIAERMQLSADVPWALRDDDADLLKDDLPIGEQLKQQTGSRLTLTPKTHLG